MNYRDFKAAVALDANEPRDYEQIVFRTPDGTNYHNVTIDFGYWNNSKDKAIIVNLFNIKPKFKVGDVVRNNSGLYPNIKYTIAVVNEELQYYGYKEVNGRTYFKDQDKLMLVKADNSKPPVEGEIKFAKSILAAIKAIKFINIKGSISFSVPENINTFKIIEKLTADKTLKIITELNSVTGDIITIKL